MADHAALTTSFRQQTRTDVDTAQFFLESANWNLEDALAIFRANAPEVLSNSSDSNDGEAAPGGAALAEAMLQQQRTIAFLRQELAVVKAALIRNLTQENPNAQNYTVVALTGKRTPIRLPQTATIFEVKMLVQHADGIPPDQQRLVYAGMQLQDEGTLGGYNIPPGSNITMILRLAGD